MTNIKWPQALRVVFLMGGVFTVAGLPVYSQTSLEDWSSLRANIGGTLPAGALWSAEEGGLGGQCYNQTFSVANQTGNTSLVGCGTTCGLANVGDPNHSCMYMAFQPNGPMTLYSYPSGYMQSYIDAGTWDPMYNRMKFTITCTTDWAAVPNEGQIGNYVKGHADPDDHTQGMHYYWRLLLSVFAGRSATIWLSPMIQHQVSAPSINFPYDPEWVYPSGSYPSAAWPVHFFDGLTRFYVVPWNTSAATTDRTCSVGKITLYKQDNEADEYVSTYTATYDGSAYELVWQGPLNNNSSYEVRYSTVQSLKTLGFNNGTLAGTTHTSGSSASDVLLTSPAMPEAQNIWFGIRPKPSVIGATNTSPIILTTMNDMRMQTGDQVTVSGVAGNTAANGTWTITSVPRTFCRQDQGCTLSWVANHLNNPNNVLVTTSSPHGLTVGMVIQTSPSGSPMFPATAEYQITSVPSSTTFTISETRIADGTYSGDYWNMPALILQGSKGNGTFTGDTQTGSGTVVATDNTKYFTEIALSKSGSAPSAPSAPSTCDLNGDGIVNATDVGLAVQAAIGTTGCVADLNGDGRCDVLDVQRVINASLPGGICKLGQ